MKVHAGDILKYRNTGAIIVIHRTTSGDIEAQFLRNNGSKYFCHAEIGSQYHKNTTFSANVPSRNWEYLGNILTVLDRL